MIQDDRMINCVFFTQGLPASGKSTAVKEYIRLREGSGGIITVISNDIIVRELWPDFDERQTKYGDPEARKMILQREEELFVEALNTSSPSTIIFDNTHINTKNIDRLRGVFNNHSNKDSWMFVGVPDDFNFTSVPVEVCIARDALREPDKVVGEKVIQGMYKRGYDKIFSKYPRTKYTIPDPYKKSAIIVDLDGTLASVGDRSFYDASNCDEVDGVNAHIETLCKKFSDTHQIIFCSGRGEYSREPTMRYLQGIFGDRLGGNSILLLMRKHGDERKDWIIKEEIYNTFIKPYYNVEFAVDDRDQVVHMWRKNGIPCLQCTYGGV